MMHLVVEFLEIEEMIKTRVTFCIVSNLICLIEQEKNAHTMIKCSHNIGKCTPVHAKRDPRFNICVYQKATVGQPLLYIYCPYMNK